MTDIRIDRGDCPLIFICLYCVFNWRGYEIISPSYWA